MVLKSELRWVAQKESIVAVRMVERKGFRTEPQRAVLTAGRTVHYSVARWATSTAAQRVSQQVVYLVASTAVLSAL